jgi:hypothetical protein
MNSYLRYKCKKLSFIPRTGLKYDRGTREYFKRCECNKGTFYTKCVAGQFQKPVDTIKLMKISLNGVQRMMFLTFFLFCRPGHESFS